MRGKVGVGLRLLLGCGLIILYGCATQVAPWQRGSLARPQMALQPDRLDAEIMHHTYDSKEAASGGYGLGGGGCGCN